MQDVEFTIERGKLWMLQTRSGKRTAKAALKIAVDMAAEGLITREEAVGRIEPNSLDQLLHPTLDPECAAHAHRARPPRLARRRHRRDRVHRRGGGAAEERGPRRHPRPQRDEPRGHPRHGRRARRPDRARRHDQPRGGRRARHGQALRLRRRRGEDRRQARHHVGRRKDLAGRRRHHHRWRERRGLSTAACRRCRRS